MAGNNEMERTGRTVSEPWGPVQEPLKALIESGRSVFGENMQRFGSGTVPGRNISGLGITTQPYYQGLLGDTGAAYKNAGQPGAAENYLTSTAQGQFLNGSPHLEGVIQSAVDPAVNSLKSMYAAAGRGFSGAMDKDFVNTIGGIRSGILNQNYQAERDRQLNAANSIEGAQQGRLGLAQNALGLRQGVLNSYTDMQGRRIALQPVLDSLSTWDPRGDVLRQYAGILGVASPYGTKEAFQKPEPIWKQVLGAIGQVSGIVRPWVGMLGDQSSDDQNTQLPSSGILSGRWSY